jgi:hypothetical protein
VLAVFGVWSLSLAAAQAFDQNPDRSLLALKTIRDEVKEMGARPGADFIQWEFFIGAPDDDDTNKTISVIVFIRTVGETEEMRIQVTYMERTPENPKVKLAKRTKSLVVVSEGDSVRVERSEFDASELPRLTEDILKAVRDKKRLLRIRSGPA